MNGLDNFSDKEIFERNEIAREGFDPDLITYFKAVTDTLAKQVIPSQVCEYPRLIYDDELICYEKSLDWVLNIIMWYQHVTLDLREPFLLAIRKAISVIDPKIHNQDSFIIFTIQFYNDLSDIDSTDIEALENAQSYVICKLFRHLDHIFDCNLIESYTICKHKTLICQRRLLIVYGENVDHDRPDINTYSAKQFFENTGISLIGLKNYTKIKVLSEEQFYSIYSNFPVNSNDFINKEASVDDDETAKRDKSMRIPFDCLQVVMICGETWTIQMHDHSKFPQFL